MTPRFKQQLLRWWLGLNIAAIEGGAVALKSFLTLAGASAAGVPVPALNLQQAAYVFLGGAAYHLIDYLTSNPLPGARTFLSAATLENQTITEPADTAVRAPIGAPIEKQPSNPNS